MRSPQIGKKRLDGFPSADGAQRLGGLLLRIGGRTVVTQDRRESAYGPSSICGYSPARLGASPRLREEAR